MSIKKYVIVEFARGDEDTPPIEIVPKIWIDFKQNICYWPPKIGTALTSLVKKGSASPTEQWSLHSFTKTVGSAGKLF